jgi:quinol monooxygenase YgiN
LSIYRIGETQAKSELIQELREFLISIMPIIKSSTGCESVKLFQNQDDPTKFTMIEVWDSVESHRASVKNIPSELIPRSKYCWRQLQSEAILSYCGFITTLIHPFNLCLKVLYASGASSKGKM